MPANEEINRVEDNKTLKNLLDFNKKDIYNRVTEGRPALVAFMTVMEMKNATNVKLLNISSKSHPKGDSTPIKAIDRYNTAPRGPNRINQKTTANTR